MDLGLLYPPPCWRSIPRAKSITARNAGVNSPAPHTDARAAGVFFPSPHTDARAAGVFSPSPFMERGGRQAGGEVKGGQQAGGEVRS